MNEPTLFDHVMSVNIPRQNRNDNYYENIIPELTNRESEVLQALKELGKPSTMHDVAKFMMRELNTISGRFGKLVEKRKLIIIGKTENNRSIYKVIS